MTEIYIDRSRLHALADAIAALEPCPFTSTVTRDQIVLAIGEHGNIWPASIRPDLVNKASGVSEIGSESGILSQIGGGV